MATVRRSAKQPASVSIPGSLGAMLGRRLGVTPKPTPVVAARKPGKLGEVVALPDPEALVLSSVLEKARRAPRRPRGGQHIHVSDLLSKCARKKILVERHNIPLAVASLSLSESLTFRQGDAIHDVIKERAVVGGPSLVWGKWRCQCNKLKIDGLCTAAEVDTTVVCEHCGTPADTYVEAEFLDDELNIIGHPDLILYFTDLSAYYVTELKSIAADGFNDLVRPQPDHILQALFYWFLMRRKGYRMVDTISILYVTKGHKFRGEPYKEFTFNAPENLYRLDDYIHEAKSILAARKGGALPARTMCASDTAPEARKCEACKFCFADPNARKPVQVSFRQAVRSAPKAGR